MASPITLDGQLTDWTRVDRLDFNTTSVNGFAVYGHTVDGLYHFAIASDQVPIGAGTTMWLNSDQNAATGYQIFNQYLGAEYKIEFVDESASGFGVRPQLYSVAQDGTSTLVEGGVTFAFSPSGQVVEFAIDKTKIGNSAAVKAVLDVNDTHFLPASYSQGEYTLKEEPLPVRTDPALKVGIVFSETSAKQYFSETAYSQLFMAVQNQAAAAGIPFDILTESDLTNLSTVVNYDTLIFPSFGFVAQDKLNAIEDVLTAAVYKYGISLVAAGNFMTNDETGLPLPGDAYARMKALLGVERVGGNAVANVTVTATGDASAAVIG
jgi:serralysin